jgi:hypothetical protein
LPAVLDLLKQARADFPASGSMSEGTKPDLEQALSDPVSYAV